MKWFCVIFTVAISCSPSVPQPVLAIVEKIGTGSRGPRIANFCNANVGKKVGNGECWTLADEAFKATGARRPGSDARVWGRPVNPLTEALLPGDIIEMKQAKFSSGEITGSHHTVVVVASGTRNQPLIAEQNWGRKTVRVRILDLTQRTSGKISVFRPS